MYRRQIQFQFRRKTYTLNMDISIVQVQIHHKTKVNHQPNSASQCLAAVSFAHNQGKFICYVLFSHNRGGLDHAIIKHCLASPCSATTIAVHRELVGLGLQPNSGFSSGVLCPQPRKIHLLCHVCPSQRRFGPCHHQALPCFTLFYHHHCCAQGPPP